MFVKLNPKSALKQLFEKKSLLQKAQIAIILNDNVAFFWKVVGLKPRQLQT